MAEIWAPATYEVSAGLEDLYRRHAPEARRLAYLLTGDHAAADDIAHDAFVKVAGRLVGLRSPDASRAYLRKAVISAANSRARSRHREDARVDAFARRQSPTWSTPTSTPTRRRSTAAPASASSTRPSRGRS